MSFSISIRNGSWLTRQRITAYCKILIAAYLIAILSWIGLANGLKDRAGTPLGADFVIVYAAGLMALQGRAPDIYDLNLHKQVEDSFTGYDAAYYGGWHYPPVFLFVASLMALLPYGLALLTYFGLGLAAGLTSIARLLPSGGLAWWSIIAFPGFFINLANGQNGALTSALLAGGLYLLKNRPWLGGLLLGALVYKPHFLALIPLLLTLRWQWRALGGCLFSAGLLSLGSAVLFGWQVWQSFIASAKSTQKLLLEQDGVGWGKIQSFFAFIRTMDGPQSLAYSGQLCIAIGAFAATLMIWRRHSAYSTRAAALCTTLLLATPYLFDYDLTVLAVPIAFLAAQGLRSNFLPYEKSFLAFVWLWPLIARGVGMHLAPLTPFVLLGLLGFCWQHTNKKAEAFAPAS